METGDRARWLWTRAGPDGLASQRVSADQDAAGVGATEGPLELVDAADPELAGVEPAVDPAVEPAAFGLVAFAGVDALLPERESVR